MADLITYISNKLSPTKSPKLVITNIKSIFIKSDDALSLLKEYLKERSWRSRESTTTSGSKQEHCRWFLHVEFVDINRTILDHLVPVLDFPSRDLPTEEYDKWDGVDFYRCRYSPSVCGRHERRSAFGSPFLDDWAGGVFDFTSGMVSRCSCTHYVVPESGVLGTMLARRNKSLKLRESPEILSCLLANHELETPRFFLDQSWLSTSDCKQLGVLVQRSCNLKYLTLHLTNLAAPQLLAEAMGNAIHLQELTIEDGNNRPSIHEEQQQQTLADTFVRPGGNDIVGRLLQNSQSCLKMLCLHSMQLDDRHFKVIVDTLPASQLEDLDVSSNNIHCQGILSFAAQLSTNKTLKRVNLARNPWEDDREEQEKAWAALQQGLAENYNIHYLGARDRSPLKRLADYYCRLNRAGRQILRSSDIVPLGLWPLILQRAGQDKDNYLRPGDSVFYFLQSSHILPHLCYTSSLKNNTRTTRQIMDVLKKVFKINLARAMITQNIMHS